LGYLVTAVDVSAAMVALCSAVPQTTVTADLMLHEITPLVDGPTVIECNLLRAGARLIAIGVDVFEGSGVGELTDLPDELDLPRVATGIASFTRADSEAARLPHVADPLGFIGRRRHWKPFHGSAPTTPLLERCGVEVLDAAAGVIELPNVAYNHNNRG